MVSCVPRICIDQFILKRVERVRKKWPLIPIAPHISADSSSEACLRQANKWLDHCLNTHRGCFPETYTATTLPSRVIAVGDATQNPYLYETAPGETGTYAALSYCWGKTRAFTTTSSTFQDRKSGFPLESLPKTCRDAVTVARALQIKYVWIDSLAIIQDSKEDWEKEAAKMCNVYSNAVVTFAALDSPDSETGLFVSELPRRTVSLTCTIGGGTKGNVYVRKHYSRLKLGFLHADHTEPHSTDYGGILQTRGWTLQELTLSPRVLWFSSWELGWSCRAETACECEPIPTSALMKRGAGRLTTVPQDNEKTDWLIMWRNFVEVFTRRSLTHQTDRLPALAGLAAAMEARIGGRYLAGLWEKECEKNLLWVSNWFVLPSPQDAPQFSTIDEDYGPSWSWASVVGPIWFLSVVVKPRFRILWKVLGIKFTPSSSNKFGPGCGTLILEVLLLALNISDDGYFVVPTESGFAYLSDTANSWFPDRIDPQDVDTLEDRELYFAFAGVLIKNMKSDKEKHTDFAGLVIERVGEEVYRRIGLVENKFETDVCEGSWYDWESRGKYEVIQIR